MFRIVGGVAKKRGRAGEEVDTNSGIQAITSYVMLVSNDDPAVVRDIVGLNISSTGEWLRKLTLTQLEEVVNKQIVYIQYVKTFVLLCFLRGNFMKGVKPEKTNMPIINIIHNIICKW